MSSLSVSHSRNSFLAMGPICCKMAGKNDREIYPWTDNMAYKAQKIHRRISAVYCKVKLALCVYSSFCSLTKSGECGGLMDSQLREHLAVHCDTGELEAVHET